MINLNLLFMVVPGPIFLDALELLVGFRALPLEQYPVGYRYELVRLRDNAISTEEM